MKKHIHKHLKVGKQAEIGVLTHPSNSRKPFIIGLVAIGAIIVLVLLVLLGPKIAGKAFYTGEENTVGIEEGIFLPATYFVVTVKANIGAKETTALGFEMSYPESLTCDNIRSNFDWTEANGAVLTEANCDNQNHKVIFRYATLNTGSAKTGEFGIARIFFGGVPAGTYNLDFTSFNIIDLDTNNPIVLTVQDAVIEVKEGAISCATTDCPACFSCLDNVCVKQDLAKYPEQFVNGGTFNGYIVVGETARPADNLAATDIATDMWYTAPSGVKSLAQVINAAKLDSEVSSLTAQNIISIGNPCVNKISAQLLGNPTDCSQGFSTGKAKIKLFKHSNGKFSMLVAGKTDEDTRLAAKVIAKRYGELSGWEVEVAGTTYSEATITKTSDVCPTPTYACTGTAPTNSQLCANDNQGLTVNTVLALKSACTDTIKCEYTCATGYQLNAAGTACEAAAPATCTDTDVDATHPDGKNRGVKGTVTAKGISLTDYCRLTSGLMEYYCVGDEGKGIRITCSCIDGACLPATTYTCTGTAPTNSQLCANDNQGLTVNTALALKSACTDTVKCEYTCATGYQLNAAGTACELVSTGGAKISLTEIGRVGEVFSTRITALETFTTELTAYTTLKDTNGKVLVLKREIVPGMTQGSTYTLSTNYPTPAGIIEKKVLVYDKLPHQGWTVHGALDMTYPLVLLE